MDVANRMPKSGGLSLMAPAAPQPSFLATRRGKLTLALLSAVAFLDFIDASIVNLALPSIRRDLDFSVQGLQWVLSGYLLTYGGFMLLGVAPATCWAAAASWSPGRRCSRFRRSPADSPEAPASWSAPASRRASEPR